MRRAAGFYFANGPTAITDAEKWNLHVGCCHRSLVKAWLKPFSQTPSDPSKVACAIVVVGGKLKLLLSGLPLAAAEVSSYQGAKRAQAAGILQRNIVRLLQCAVCVIDLSSLAFRHHPLGPAAVVPSGLLLPCLQILLAVCDDSSSSGLREAIRIPDVLALLGTASRCSLRRSQWSRLPHAASNSSAKNSLPVDHSPVALLSQRVLLGKKVQTQQEAMIATAIQKVLWISLESVVLAAANEMAVRSPAFVQAQSFVSELSRSYLSAPNFGVKEAAQSIGSEEGFRRRLRVLQQLVTTPLRDSLLISKCPTRADNSNKPVEEELLLAVNKSVILNLFSLQLWTMNKMLMEHDTTGDKPPLGELEVSQTFAWLLDALLGLTTAASSSTTGASRLIPEASMFWIKAIASDAAAMDLLQPMWCGHRDLVRMLCCCTPPEGARRDGSSSTGDQPSEKGKSKKEGGLFAELRKLSEEKKRRKAAAQGPSASVFRGKNSSSRSSEARQVAALSLVASFSLPLWVKGAAFVQLLCCQGTFTPLNGLSFLGPVTTTSLLAALTENTALPSLLDLLYIAHPEVLPSVTSELKTAITMDVLRRWTLAVNASLSLFASMMSHLLMVTGDKEFEELDCPIPFCRVKDVVMLFNAITLNIVERQLGQSATAATGESIATLVRGAVPDGWLREDVFRLKSALSSTIRSLIDRSLRIPQFYKRFAPDSSVAEESHSDDDLSEEERSESFWFLDKKMQKLIFPEFSSEGLFGKKKVKKDTLQDAGTLQSMRPIQRAVLTAMPHVAPFALRIRFFNTLLAEDRKAHGAALSSKLGLTIRRTHILEDAIEQLRLAHSVCPAGDTRYLRMKWHVTFVNAHGSAEAGIDAGGVFKEFIEKVAQEAFDPNSGLFVPIGAVETATGESVSSNLLHPNPDAIHLFKHLRPNGFTPGSREPYLDYYSFIGRLVAKAIYEGIVLNVHLAPTFLNNVLGRGCTLDDLRVIDPQQFQSLQLLKAMPDVEDASLYFCVEEEAFGGVTETVDLVANGRDIAVTNDNVVRYLHLLAHYKLVRRNKRETDEFSAGFFELLPRAAVVSLFHSKEAQQLISGRAGMRLDVDDLRRHCKLVGGIEEGSRTLNLLWEILEEFTAEDQARFLQFCTGSSKPPLLGFGSMNPPFSIRGVEEGSVLNFVVDMDRLPSASTCFNLLKLPLYRNKANMKEKLLQAICSGAGFDLS